MVDASTDRGISAERGLSIEGDVFGDRVIGETSGLVRPDSVEASGPASDPGQANEASSAGVPGGETLGLGPFDPPSLTVTAWVLRIAVCMARQRFSSFLALPSDFVNACLRFLR
jgi:hypothetical protein